MAQSEKAKPKNGMYATRIRLISTATLLIRCKSFSTFGSNDKAICSGELLQVCEKQDGTLLKLILSKNSKAM